MVTCVTSPRTGFWTLAIRALRFFEPEGKEADLACQVIAIMDWAVEYNEFMTQPLPEIPTELQVPYSGSRQDRGQFPLAPTLVETSSMDVCIRCQAQWTYLCAILQYFEDDMAAREGALYGGRTCQPSALMQYIMDHVNPGLPEHFWVEWLSIVGSTPWLIAREHMSQEDQDRFNNEPLSDSAMDLEVATEEVCERQVRDKIQRMVIDQPKDTPQNLVDVPPQATGRTPLLPLEEQPHKFVPDKNWTLVTGKTGRKTEALEGELVELTDLDVELGVKDVQEVLDNYLTEDAVAVQNLIHVELGLTGGEDLETMGVAVETVEAMEVDPPMVFKVETTHLPMHNRMPEAPMGTFQPELTSLRYTPSLIGSVDTPLSPITAADNTLLDVTDLETQSLKTSKAPGAGRPEGSPDQESPLKPGMTLWKRKPPPM